MKTESNLFTYISSNNWSAETELEDNQECLTSYILQEPARSRNFLTKQKIRFQDVKKHKKLPLG